MIKALKTWMAFLCLAWMASACSGDNIEGFVPVRTTEGLAYQGSTRPQDTQFHGIVDFMFANGSSPDGVHRSRLIFVHGICPHSYDNWVRRHVEKIVPTTLSRLGDFGGFEYLPIKGEQDFYTSAKNRNGSGDVRIYRTVARGQAWETEVFFVLWSDLVQAQRDSLDLNDSELKGSSLPSLNVFVGQQIKTAFVNGCLAEVATFAQDREKILSPIRTALKGAIERSNRRSPRFRETDFFLISHSLGSRISTDLIGTIKIGKEKTPLTCSLKAMFFMANQIPLFGITGVNSASKELVDFTASLALNKARERRSPCSESSIQVVAFSDPADVLSYRLTPNDFGKNIRNINSLYKIFNVTVDNSNIFIKLGTLGLTGAGFLVDLPGFVTTSASIGSAGFRLYQAHTAYALNPDVVNHIFYGADQKFVPVGNRGPN